MLNPGPLSRCRGLVRWSARVLLITGAVFIGTGSAGAGAIDAYADAGSAGVAHASAAVPAAARNPDSAGVVYVSAVARNPDSAGVVYASAAAQMPHSAAAGAGAGAATSKASPVTRAMLTDEVTPALPGGVCQVPGIGDIGGLVGLCSAGSSGLIGDLNSICEPSLPQPEQANGGIDAMIQPPESAAGGKTLYDNYGVAGQFWAAHGQQCSDMTSLVGNNVAGMVFDGAKALDRVTITVYQSAAGNNILTWLRNAVDKLISALGHAIYFPYLAPVVLLGAMWLAWQGLVRKRATRAIEGTLWMVIAATAAICLIGDPGAFTGVGTTVSNGVTQVLNTAFANLPNPGDSDCLPVQAGDQQSVTANYAFTSGNGLVDKNADELWSVLVCKPWLYGEFGTTTYTQPGQKGPQTVVNLYGRQLLWSQAIATNETPTTALINAKQSTYDGIAADLQANDPGIYPLFQGNQWTTRLEIAFAAMFAALVAGMLILLIALTLIVLKLGFLLLLVAGPFFLIVGTHPGFGRIIAIRWFEMLVGVLMKQVAIAIVLSVLLYCYSLIMGTSDAVLPWALKILMITLVTVTVFIYRRPFQHLFSAVGYGAIGSQERADYSLREASSAARGAAAGVLPGVSRAARWARRNPGQAAALGATVATGGAAAGAAGGAGADSDGQAGDAYASRLRPDVPSAVDGDGGGGGGGRRSAGTVSGNSARARAATEADSTSGRTAPPLELPARSGSAASGGHSGSGRSGSGTSGGARSGNGTSGNGSGAGSAASGWSRGAGHAAGSPRARAGSLGPQGTGAAPPPPLSGGGGGGGGSGNGSNGSGASGPTWPASGWPGTSARQRQATEGRPAPEPRPVPPGEGNGKPGTEQGSGGQAPRTFWTRSRRRDK